jgi:GNAT superfamily N-acetyltransferase
MEITYRFLDTESDSDISQWLDLYSVCFQQEITRNFWDYIHLKNPFYKKTKPLIFIAQADGKIVGSLSAIPSPLAEYPKDTIILHDSLLICKGMVHPEYQKKGIFGHLLKKAMKTAESEEYDFVLTISNNFYSYQSFIRNGFHDIAAMRWSRLFLSRDTVFSAYIEALLLPRAVKKMFLFSCTYCYSRLVPRKNHSYQIKYGDAPEFIEEIENFYASTHQNEGLYGSRATAFNRWKFREGVSFKCFTICERETMLGYAIVQLKERNAYIIDIGFSGNKKKVIAELIGGISTTLKEYNFQTVWTYMVENDTILSNFFTLRHGFFIRSSNAGKLKKSRLLVYPLKKTPAQSSTLDKNTWNIQAVDTCLFLE